MVKLFIGFNAIRPHPHPLHSAVSCSFSSVTSIQICISIVCVFLLCRTYQNLTGQTFCRSCEIGRYSDATEAQICSACDVCMQRVAFEISSVAIFCAPL